jgi:hypothetical protein
MLKAYEDALPYRLAFGLAFFGALAAWEAARNGRKSARLREYGFLLFTTFASIVFAVIHDHVTATVSPEYFLAGKGLYGDPRPFRLAVTMLSIKASYWVGLLLGTALLVANNPSPTRPQLAYAPLMRLTLLPLVGAVSAAAVLGTILRLVDFGQRSAAAAVVYEVDAFVTVWGMHAGSYLGALVGGVAAVTIVVQRRRGRPRQVADHAASPP